MSAPRHLAIGDIHGCDVALRTLLECVKLQSNDVIITLGDYPSRGPNTKRVFDLLIELDQKYCLIPVRGNHDIMMLEARKDRNALERWVDVGGDATLVSYGLDHQGWEALDEIPSLHWQFLAEKLVSYYETATHFFVHANAYPDLPLTDQPDYMLYWEHFDNPSRHLSGKIMVCGHTPQKSGLPLSNGDAICIDTGCCVDGWLTCLHVETGQIWQASQHGATRHLWLDDCIEL